MTWLEKEFDLELELIREENPQMSLADQLQLTATRMEENCQRYIARIREKREQAHQEAINLAFFK